MFSDFIKKVILAGLALSLLWVVSRASLVVHVASYVAYPVLRGYHVAVASIKQWVKPQETAGELYNQLSELQQEVSNVRAQNIYLRAKMAYMQGIDELRKFNERYKKEGIIARILARDFSEQSNHFYIDVGAQDHMEKDMVVTYKNNLVGRITEVYPWYSKVCLITDRHCKVAAYSVASKAHGIHEGSNKSEETSLCHVSHLAEAKEGELVLSSGEGLLFPEGLALGRIMSCQTKGFCKEITVKPLCDLKQIEYCSVVPRG